MTDNVHHLVHWETASRHRSARETATRDIRDDLGLLATQLEDLIREATERRNDCWAIIDRLDALLDLERKEKASMSPPGRAP
jgi:hypothetical protein